MTTAHILTLVAFIFVGAAGLAAIQESLSVCFRAIFPRRANTPRGRQGSQASTRFLITR